MPEEKEYGYARDMADIDDPGQIPTEVTGNAIEAFLMDHPEELESGFVPMGRIIENHDYILDTHNADTMILTKGDLDEFDAKQRAAVVTASGSLETEESDESDDETAAQ